MTHVIASHIPTVRHVAHASATVGWALLLPLIWARRIRQRRELMGLLGQPDRLIADVGLQRDVITREALKPFWLP
jgi:uncharacterized protein YjiS (DUF1127 family)